MLYDMAEKHTASPHDWTSQHIIFHAVRLILILSLKYIKKKFSLKLKNFYKCIIQLIIIDSFSFWSIYCMTPWTHGKHIHMYVSGMQRVPVWDGRPCAYLTQHELNMSIISLSRTSENEMMNCHRNRQREIWHGPSAPDLTHSSVDSSLSPSIYLHPSFFHVSEPASCCVCFSIHLLSSRV